MNRVSLLFILLAFNVVSQHEAKAVLSLYPFSSIDWSKFLGHKKVQNSTEKENPEEGVKPTDIILTLPEEKYEFPFGAIEGRIAIVRAKRYIHRRP